MECFSYKGGRDIREHTGIEALEELAWAIDKWLWVTSDTLFKTVITLKI